jgi:hypothetical protein
MCQYGRLRPKIPSFGCDGEGPRFPCLFQEGSLPDGLPSSATGGESSHHDAENPSDPARPRSSTRYGQPSCAESVCHSFHLWCCPCFSPRSAVSAICVHTHPNLRSDPALCQLGTLITSHRNGEPRPTDGPRPGGAYQYGYADGGKRCGRRLETGVLPELPVTRSFTIKQVTPRIIISRPVKKGLLQVEVVCPLATRNYKVSATVGVSTTVFVECGSVTLLL